MDSRFEDDNRNSSYDTHINWEQVAQHFQSQGKPENINVDFTSRVKEFVQPVPNLYGYHMNYFYCHPQILNYKESANKILDQVLSNV
jgi:hypothetical protein